MIQPEKAMNARHVIQGVVKENQVHRRSVLVVLFHNLRSNQEGRVNDERDSVSCPITLTKKHFIEITHVFSCVLV